MANALKIEDEIVAALRRIIRAVDLHSRRLVHAVGLTWPQLATLRAAERLGACSIGALAREVHLLELGSVVIACDAEESIQPGDVHALQGFVPGVGHARIESTRYAAKCGGATEPAQEEAATPAVAEETADASAEAEAAATVIEPT